MSSRSPQAAAPFGEDLLSGAETPEVSVSQDQDPSPDSADPVPFGQRLYDNWAVLMVLGIVIMVVIFTGWGLWEITSLEPSPLR